MTDDRWLASVGSDGSICFWKYRVGTTEFEFDRDLVSFPFVLKKCSLIRLDHDR